MTVSNNTIAEYLSAKSQQIVKRRDVDGGVVVLVDWGIGGIKKYTIPYADLTKPKPPKPAPVFEEEPEETAVPEPVPTVDLDDCTVAELQDMARERDISYSGLRKAELIEALEAN